MQNQKSIFLGVIIALVIGAGWYFFVLPRVASQTEKEIKEEGIVLYYSDICPHCKNVEAFIEQNGTKGKISFVEKEVSKDQASANELVERSLACGFPQDQIGVPMLWENDKCTVGDEPIIEFFKEKTK